jgi:hypothetical protein
MELTVLSAFARLDVDPWVEAADLSQLPRATASARFVSMLESLPGHSSLADRTAIAGRLIPLLPDRLERPRMSDGPGQRVPAETGPAWIGQVSFSLLYFAVLCLGLLLYSEFSDRAPENISAAASTTVTADRTPTHEAAPAGPPTTPHESR